MGLGLLVLLGGWVVLAPISFVLSSFQQSPWLGGLAGGVAALGLGLLGAAIWREVRSLRALRNVDHLRALLTDAGNLMAARDAVKGWVRRLDRLPDQAATLAALDDAASIAALRNVVRNLVITPLRRSVTEIGKQAALEGGALVAITPHAGLDGLIAGVRGLAVVRRVAALYGLRPGMTVTLVLLRRVVLTAASTAGVDLISSSLADQALSNLPVVKHLAAAVPGAGVAALRLYRLAGITATACDPLPD